MIWTSSQKAKLPLLLHKPGFHSTVCRPTKHLMDDLRKNTLRWLEQRGKSAFETQRCHGILTSHGVQ
jgi:hypothetical protein